MSSIALLERIYTRVRNQRPRDIVGALIGITVGLWMLFYVMPPIEAKYPPLWREIYSLSLITIWILTEVRPWLARRRPWTTPVIRWAQGVFFLVGFVYPLVRYGLFDNRVAPEMVMALLSYGFPAMWLAIAITGLYLLWRIARAIERLKR